MISENLKGSKLFTTCYVECRFNTNQSQQAFMEVYLSISTGNYGKLILLSIQFL